LKLQKYLKQNTQNYSQKRSISALGDETTPSSMESDYNESDTGAQDENSSSSSSNFMWKEILIRSDVDAVNESKKRYYQSLSDVQSVESPAIMTTSIESEFSTRKTQTHLSHDSHQHIEGLMFHCHGLWASCHVESVCNCVYQCLQFSNENRENLPFGYFPDDPKSLPHQFHSFAHSSTKDQKEIDVLYSSLVHVLVTGDFIGFQLCGDLLRVESCCCHDVDAVTAFVLSPLR
jgi:hypothetical protein